MLDSIVTNLLDFANKFASHASEVLIAFAAIGALTMAILQTIKDLTPVRSIFNKAKVTNWLNRQQTRPHGATLQQAMANAPDGLTDLLILSTAAHEAALFDLELERLAGQISAAAGIVVDYPERHAKLLWALAASAEEADIAILVTAAQGGYLQLRNLQAAQPDQYDELLAAKIRVTHQVQRNIDGFQISTAFTWKVYVQYASFIVSFVLTGIALTLSTASFGLAVILLVGLAAGFFAPIARDLVAILDKARRAS